MNELEPAIGDLEIARSFWERLRGLLGRQRLGSAGGLLLSPCRAIHTIGMKFSIDIVFVGPTGEVLRIDHAVPPNRLRFCWRARAVIELSAGWARSVGLFPGQHLSQCVNLRGNP